MCLLMPTDDKTRLVVKLCCILLWTKYCYGCKIINSTADCSNKNLTSVPQDLDPNITTLNLNGNHLRQLKNRSFEKYRLLKKLFINNNDRLLFMEEDAFYGLKQLLYLSLQGNNLTLQLSYPKYVFRPLSKLKRLDLSSNFFSSKITTPIYYPYFGHLKNLYELHLDLMSNAYFNESGFHHTKQLTVLIFPYCALNDMNNNSFQGIARSVKSIHIERCFHVKKVQLDFLSPFPKLENISLHRSYLSLSSALSLLYPFRNKYLKSIDFNHVAPIDKDSVIVTRKMMEYLTTICVENLLLTNTEIVDFENGSLLNYNYPECFRMMVFTGNRFSISSSKKLLDLMLLFQNMKNLTLFDFSYIPLTFINITYITSQKPYFGFQSDITGESYNKLSMTKQKHELRYETFSLPPMIRTLRISHFLGNFQGDPDHTITIIIKNASNLLYLDMSYIQLTYVPDIVFDGPNNIKYVDFSGIDSELYCEKKIIPNFENATTVILQNAKINFVILKIHKILRIFQNVQKLDLSWNKLWYLPCDSFSKNKIIKQLILIGNNFLDIPIAIKYLSYLELFDISYNYLRNINKSFTNWFDQQQKKTKTFKLKLLDNVLKCTCSNTDFISWLFKPKINIVDSHKLTCSLENGTIAYVKHVHRRFHELFKNCNNVIWLKIGIGCLVGFIVLTTPAAVVFNFRWQIAYFIYRKFKRVIENNIKETFKYDMYICYVEESVNWIRDVLVLKVENKWKMSLFITDRDALSGDTTSDAIAEAIKQSRHVLIILSSRFRMGVWTSYELDRIKYEKYSNQLQKIIIIARNVSAEDVPVELDNLWKDAIIINWSDSEEEAGWDKLRLNLFSEAI